MLDELEQSVTSVVAEIAELPEEEVLGQARRGSLRRPRPRFPPRARDRREPGAKVSHPGGGGAHRRGAYPLAGHRARAGDDRNGDRGGRVMSAASHTDHAPCRVSAARGFGAAMEFDAIRAALPQQVPFVLVDRVVALEPGVRITCLKNVSGAEPIFGLHFPTFAVFPGVLLLEAMAQCTSLLLGAAAAADGALPVLAAADDVRWLRPVRPGDQLLLRATVKRRVGRPRRRGVRGSGGGRGGRPGAAHCCDREVGVVTAVARARDRITAFVDGRTLLRIPAGRHRCGELGREHARTLPTVYLAERPVTNADYVRFCTATGHPRPRWYGARFAALERRSSASASTTPSTMPRGRGCGCPASTGGSGCGTRLGPGRVACGRGMVPREQRRPPEAGRAAVSDGPRLPRPARQRLRVDHGLVRRDADVPSRAGRLVEERRRRRASGAP